MKKIYFILMLFLTVVLINITGCKDDEPEAPIFSGVEQIFASYNTGTGQIEFNVTEDTAYVIIGVFNAPIVTQDKAIVNYENLVYGSRTGLSGFTLGSVYEVNLHAYDQGTEDFAIAETNPPNSPPYAWAVWGFNSNWSIVCATGQYTNTFTQ